MKFLDALCKMRVNIQNRNVWVSVSDMSNVLICVFQCWLWPFPFGKTILRFCRGCSTWTGSLCTYLETLWGFPPWHRWNGNSRLDLIQVWTIFSFIVNHSRMGHQQLLKAIFGHEWKPSIPNYAFNINLQTHGRPDRWRLRDLVYEQYGRGNHAHEGLMNEGKTSR